MKRGHRQLLFQFPSSNKYLTKKDEDKMRGFSGRFCVSFPNQHRPSSTEIHREWSNAITESAEGLHEFSGPHVRPWPHVDF